MTVKYFSSLSSVSSSYEKIKSRSLDNDDLISMLLYYSIHKLNLMKPHLKSKSCYNEAMNITQKIIYSVLNEITLIETKLYASHQLASIYKKDCDDVNDLEHFATLLAILNTKIAQSKTK